MKGLKALQGDYMGSLLKGLLGPKEGSYRLSIWSFDHGSLVPLTSISHWILRGALKNTPSEARAFRSIYGYEGLLGAI